MPNQNPGDSFWMEAEITDKNGKAVVPDTHQITLTGPRCNTSTSNVNHIRGSTFEVLVQIPVTGGKGLYTLSWVVTKDGVGETEKYNFVVH